MLCGKNKERYNQMVKLISYPARRTHAFNEDGNNLFHSRIMFLVFIPSFILFLVLAYVLVATMLTDDLLKTKFTAHYIARQFPLMANDTNDLTRPVSEFYSSINKLVGNGGIHLYKIRPKVLFDSIRVTIQDASNYQNGEIKDLASIPRVFFKV